MPLQFVARKLREPNPLSDWYAEGVKAAPHKKSESHAGFLPLRRNLLVRRTCVDPGSLQPTRAFQVMTSMKLAQEIHRLGAQTRTLPPKLETLITYWLQKCDGRAMPRRDDLPVQELRPWLGHLALIEIGADPLIRVCGTNLIRRFGREATGDSVGDLAYDIGQQLRAILKAAARASSPIIAVSLIPLGRSTVSYCEAALPLAGPDGNLATVLLGAYEIR